MQIPSQIAGERVGYHRWLPFILLAWGAVATSMTGLGPQPYHLYIIRFLLGARIPCCKKGSTHHDVPEHCLQEALHIAIVGKGASGSRSVHCCWATIAGLGSWVYVTGSGIDAVLTRTLMMEQGCLRRARSRACGGT